jgi:hypothetical protein
VKQYRLSLQSEKKASGIFSLKETDFDREAFHSTYVKNELNTVAHFFLLHEAQHLFTIFKNGRTVEEKQND